MSVVQTTGGHFTVEMGFNPLAACQQDGPREWEVRPSGQLGLQFSLVSRLLAGVHLETELRPLGQLSMTSEARSFVDRQNDWALDALAEPFPLFLAILLRPFVTAWDSKGIAWKALIRRNFTVVVARQQLRKRNSLFRIDVPLSPTINYHAACVQSCSRGNLRWVG